MENATIQHLEQADVTALQQYLFNCTPQACN
jgi:hypothetical protein